MNGGPEETMTLIQPVILFPEGCDTCDHTVHSIDGLPKVG